MQGGLAPGLTVRWVVCLGLVRVGPGARARSPEGLGVGLVMGRRVQLHPSDDLLARSLVQAVDCLQQ